MRKNKKLIMAMAVILAIATLAAGSTFAWFTSIDQATNHMETGQLTNGDVKIAEVFDPDDPFAPGVDINKDVWAVNTGSVDALVRMSFTEALTMLGNDGEHEAKTAGWVKADEADFIPQQFSASSIAAGGAYDMTAGGDWKKVVDYIDRAQTDPADDIFDAFTIPAGVTLLFKETEKKIGSQTITEYSFVAYYTIPTHSPATEYDGLLQYVVVDIEAEKLSSGLVKLTAVADATKNPKAPNAWNFYVFEKGTKNTFDWTDAGTYPLTLAAADVTPANPNRYKVFNPDDVDGCIELLFKAGMVTTTPATGKWWYNAADGYFYYIGKVAPGHSTPELLDAVGLNEAAGIEYCLLNFDLIVNMEAIQNVEAALSSDTGWKLSDPTLTALKAALTTANAFELS